MNLNSKSVLVTGGAGFIGSHLVEALIAENPKEITIVDDMSLGKERNIAGAKKNFKHLNFYREDASKFEIMAKILKEHSVDVLFNLAVIPLPASLVLPRESTEKNIQIVSTLCELQRLDYFTKLVHFSSSESYGSAQYEPMDEKHPLGPSTPYAASKAAGDLIVLSYHKSFGTESSIIRPFNNYGPRQNEGSYAGIIPLTIKRVLNGESPVIYGDGKQTRDYLYVTDTARAALDLCKNENTVGKVINIGCGKETNILTIVQLIQKYLNSDKQIKFEAPRIGDVRRHIANIYSAEDILGFKPTISFEKGLKLTVEWYKTNGGGCYP